MAAVPGDDGVRLYEVRGMSILKESVRMNVKLEGVGWYVVVRNFVVAVIFVAVLQSIQNESDISRPEQG